MTSTGEEHLPLRPTADVGAVTDAPPDRVIMDDNPRETLVTQHHAARDQEPRHLPRAGHHPGPALHGYELARRRLPPASCEMRSRIQMRLECPIHGIVPREETVKGYEIAKDEYVRFEPEELKALEQASSSALVIDSFVPEAAVDPVYFEDTYYLGAGKNGERGYRVLVEALEKTHRVAVGTFTWRGKTTPITDPRAPERPAPPAALLRRRGIQRDRDRPRCCTEDPGPGADARRAADQRAIRDRVPSRELRGRVPETSLEGDRAEGRGSGDPAPRGRGPAPDDRPGRDAQGEPRTEGVGEGAAH